MALPLDVLTRKRGRPRTYTSTKAKQVSNVTQRRNRRQSARAVYRAQQFDQHYSTTVPLSTDINEPPSIYFPPGELSIATEVEQLLPPLSPDLRLWEPPMPKIPPIDNEVLLESTSDIANDPALAISPDSV
ncbi:uncharacterized protein N7529_007359 [Penicillium soppii]|uniref:uncharacterized protein n=1 Tax=Penicillium soppii TaxID=69789 RepID=UPI00254946FC|nr:uncharacterized protein N7529_007359 [Penicillium soppii]KAJ5865443.1 hypothetical protein N7529_007359 [Penicillium soppii]